jgi:hypothetical protein
MDKKKRDKVKPVAKKGPAKGEAQEDLELADEAAQRVKGGSFSFGANALKSKL